MIKFIASNITAMLQKSAKNLYKPTRENPKCIVSEKIIYRTKKSKIGLALVLVLRIMVQNFIQTFAIYRPDNNVFVLQNSLYNVYVNSSSTKLKNIYKVGC